MSEEIAVRQSPKVFIKKNDIVQPHLPGIPMHQPIVAQWRYMVQYDFVIIGTSHGLSGAKPLP